jgi:hypothetical protein
MDSFCHGWHNNQRILPQAACERFVDDFISDNILITDKGLGDLYPVLLELVQKSVFVGVQTLERIADIPREIIIAPTMLETVRVVRHT